MLTAGTSRHDLQAHGQPAIGIRAVVVRQVTATASWNITDDISMFLSTVNLTNEVIFQHTGDRDPRGLLRDGRATARVRE